MNNIGHYEIWARAAMATSLGGKSGMDSQLTKAVGLGLDANIPFGQSFSGFNPRGDSSGYTDDGVFDRLLDAEARRLKKTAR